MGLNRDVIGQMNGPRVYLDYNASAPLLPAARAAVVDALDRAGNASSVHAEGREARRIVEGARRAVAALAGASAENVTFTSGATEAASMLLTPDWRMGRGALAMGRLYVSATEHPCILGGGHFPPERRSLIGVDGDGIVDVAALNAALLEHDAAQGRPLVAVQLANNETGVIQPVGEIGRLVRAAGGVTIVDAVQAAGRIDLDISAICADFIILSSHKIGGPQGAGAVVGAGGLLMPAPLVRGGGQERGHRAGTENVAAIAGFGAAAAAALDHLAQIDGLRQMRDRIEAVIERISPRSVFHGRNAERLVNTSCFTLDGMKAETAQIAFDLAGVALSSGSACSSGRVGPSHVLMAMGAGDEASALRVSLGHGSGEGDVDRFASALSAIVARQRSNPRAA